MMQKKNYNGAILTGRNPPPHPPTPHGNQCKLPTDGRTDRRTDRQGDSSLTSKCKGTFLSPSCFYHSMYEIWKLHIENYSSYCVSPKVLTKFRCDLAIDLLTPKCIGIFLLPSCIYVWNMKAVRWKLLKLSCQNQSVDKVQLWPWPLTFWHQNIYRYLSLTILHLCMKYDSCTLKLPTLLCQNQSVDKVQLWPWPFDPKTHRYLPLNILHLC